MDRASDSGSEGWGFESLPVYQKYREAFASLYFLHRKGLERAAQPQAGQKLRTVEQFLARGRVLSFPDASLWGMWMETKLVELQAKYKRVPSGHLFILSSGGHTA